MKTNIFIFFVLFLVGCTTREFIRPPITGIPNTVDTLFIDTSSTHDTTIIYSEKIDTVTHDTTIIKYYPYDNKFVIKRTDSMLRLLNEIRYNQQLILLETDSLTNTYSRLNSIFEEHIKEKPNYPFISKLGWSFIGVFIVVVVIVIIGLAIFFKKP